MQKGIRNTPLENRIHFMVVNESSSSSIDPLDHSRPLVHAAPGRGDGRPRRDLLRPSKGNHSTEAISLAGAAATTAAASTTAATTTAPSSSRRVWARDVAGSLNIGMLGVVSLLYNDPSVRPATFLATALANRRKKTSSSSSAAAEETEAAAAATTTAPTTASEEAPAFLSVISDNNNYHVSRRAALMDADDVPPNAVGSCYRATTLP